MMGIDLVNRNGFLFFLREWPSNWESSPFHINGIYYNCVEQYFMAEKARCFDDHTTLNKILATDSPAEQKKLGGQVTPFDNEIWAAVRYDIMLRGNLEKYRQNPGLRKRLLGSVGTFVEANPYDKIWGIGMKKTDPGIEDPSNWRGQNLLGEVLMSVRDTLRQEESK